MFNNCDIKLKHAKLKLKRKILMRVKHEICVTQKCN